MWIGWIEFDVLLGNVHSLKEKRAIVRPIVAELKRKYEVAHLRCVIKNVVPDPQLL